MTKTPTARPTLAVCMLVRDEIALIADSVRSVATLADQLIVVDNGSEDGTGELANEMGATVIWAPDKELDNARDAYIHAARTDWILVIDVDERILPADVPRIRSLIETAPATTAGFALPRHDYLGAGRWANGRLLRLFRANKRIRYEGGPIHATPWASIKVLGQIDSTAYVPLHHLDLLLKGPNQSKRDRYRLAMERSLAAGDGGDAFSAYLAAEYWAIGEYDQAIRTMRTKIEQSQTSARDAVFMAQFLLHSGSRREAQEFAEASLRLSERYREAATTVLAELMLERNDIAQAYTVLAGAAAHRPESPSAHINVATVLRLSGNHADADEHIARALFLNPLLGNPLIHCPAVPLALYRHQDAILRLASPLLSELAREAAGLLI